MTASITPPGAATHPFRFYGSAPAAWGDGANCGHQFELHFAQPPDGATRLAIARVFETATRGRVVNSRCRPWLWGGQWALVTAGERRDLVDRAQYGAQLTAAFRAVHAVAPLIEAVCLSIHGAPVEDLWQQWSVRQRALPERAPRWPGMETGRRDFYGARVERYAVACAEDPAFESERRLVRQQNQAAAAAAAAAALDEAERATRLALVRSGESLTQMVASAPVELVDALAGQDWYAVGPEHAVVALARSDDAYVVSVGNRHGLRPVVPALAADSVAHSFTVDGGHVLLAVGGTVHEVDVATGARRELYEAGGTVVAAQWVAGFLAVQKLDALELLARDGAGLKLAHRIPTARAQRIVAVRGGRALLSMSGNTRFPVSVLGFGAGAARLVARFEKRVNNVWETDARVFAKDADHYQSYYELRFLDGAIDAALARPEEAIDLATETCPERCRALIVDDELG